MRTRLILRTAFGVFVVVSAGWGLSMLFQPRSATSDPVPEEPAPSPPVHPPFTPYAADEGALTFEQLDPVERAVVEAERTRESPEALEARFARLRAIAIERGERTRAEVAASVVGLEGFDIEGVLP